MIDQEAEKYAGIPPAVQAQPAAGENVMDVPHVTIGERNLAVTTVSEDITGMRESLQGISGYAESWLTGPATQSQLLQTIVHPVQASNDAGRRILHIEDDDDILMLVQAMLNESWEVVPAKNIHDARERLDEGYYDLVMLDITLPDGSGLELLPDIRALSCPVMLFSESLPNVDPRNFDRVLVKADCTGTYLLNTILELTGAG